MTQIKQFIGNETYQVYSISSLPLLQGWKVGLQYSLFPGHLHYVFCSMIPVGIILALLIREKKVVELEYNCVYDWDKIFAGNVWLIVYMILSFSLIWILVFWGRNLS